MHLFSVVTSMKTFATATFALLSLAFLSACSMQASVLPKEEEVMNDDTETVRHDGPYLEDMDDDEDMVELHVGASGSIIQQ